jgi:tRNA A-37 threonylcarbamoyl transferase component Bud32
MKAKHRLELTGSKEYPTAYAEQGSRTQGAAGPLKQIFGYMKCNGFKYGVLSTYEQTWFVKRDDQDNVVVSPTVRSTRENPTMLRCYLWFVRQTHDDAERFTGIPDQQEIDKWLKKERKSEKDKDRDWMPRRGVKEIMQSGLQAITRRLESKDRCVLWLRLLDGSLINRLTLRYPDSQTRSNQSTERTVIPAFEKLNLIWYGERARSYSASWQGMDVIVKKCDAWKEPSVVKELEHEAEVYSVLQALQGRCIPVLRVAGIANGIEMILVMDFMGTNIVQEHLDCFDQEKIRTALSMIHNEGVLHGDIRPQNILGRRDGHDSRFFFIDFGLSSFTTDKVALRQEAQELDALLESMK